MIKKDYLTELDMRKKEYYNVIMKLQSEAAKNFQSKNRERIMESLNMIAELASFAYDIEMLKEVSFA
jgi:hypothetical protein